MMVEEAAELPGQRERKSRMASPRSPATGSWTTVEPPLLLTREMAEPPRLGGLSRRFDSLLVNMPRSALGVSSSEGMPRRSRSVAEQWRHSGVLSITSYAPATASFVEHEEHLKHVMWNRDPIADTLLDDASR